MISRITTFLFVGLAVATVIAMLVSPWARVDAQESQMTQAYEPYTATIVTRHYNGAGKLGASIVSIRARRQDGSIAKIKQLINDEVSGNKVVVDTVAGVRVAVDPITQSKTTYPLPTGDRSNVLELRVQSCDGPVQETIELGGFEARKFRREIRHGNSGAGTAELTVFDEWLAPKLNCEPLRIEASLMSEDGTVKARNVEEVIWVTAGRPDDALFDVPAFPEKPPSQVLAEYDRIKGREVCESCTRGRGHLDTAYHSSNSQTK